MTKRQSWWVGLSPEQFYRVAKVEARRMRNELLPPPVQDYFDEQEAIVASEAADSRRGPHRNPPEVADHYKAPSVERTPGVEIPTY